MEIEKVDQLFKQADKDLEHARTELFRPSGDVVTYSVCVPARSALYRYLKCLYIQNAKNKTGVFEDTPSLEELITFSGKYNKELRQTDFSNIHCKNCDVMNSNEVFYCNDVTKVKYCTDLAEKIRNIVIENRESDLPDDSFLTDHV